MRKEIMKTRIFVKNRKFLAIIICSHLEGSDENTNAGVNEVLHAASTGFQVLLGSQLLLSQLEIVGKI
jgi:hypothetical protein